MFHRFSVSLRFALAIALLAFLPACEDGACAPECSSGCGNENGCGSFCGCPSGQQCNSAGQCVAPEDCFETCHALDWECGQLCGDTCGTCVGGAACQRGTCSSSCVGPECPDCEPQCGPGCGREDGCGGTCGCPEGEECTSEGVCVAEQACHGTCATTAWVCGEVCGQSCGSCGSDTLCHQGQCLSEKSTSCADCSLRLVQLEETRGAGDVTRVVVGLDYDPQENEARPRMADIRVAASPLAELIAVAGGPALSVADKQIYTNPISGQAWRQRPDGTYQILLVSLANTNRFATGRLLTLTFNLEGSATIGLVKRDQILAPPVAEARLQSSSYDSPVVVVK